MSEEQLNPNATNPDTLPADQPETTNASPEQGVVETLPSLEESLRQAELKASEHHDAWLRAKAETENVRRRAAEDVEKARKFAVDRIAGELLAVKDSLEAALTTGDKATLETVLSGVEITLKQLSGVFEKNNIVEVNPLGAKFDPNAHQAIGMVDSDQEPNTVAQVLQKGYLLNERVLRPALVMVAKAK
jgi:molecular chaperone GrpE